MTPSSFNTCDGIHFCLRKESHLDKELLQIVELLDALPLVDGISPDHQSSQTDKHHCINPILDEVILHIQLSSQPHENTEKQNICRTDLLDLKFMILIARHGEGKWS